MPLSEGAICTCLKGKNSNPPLQVELALWPRNILIVSQYQCSYSITWRFFFGGGGQKNCQHFLLRADSASFNNSSTFCITGSF